MNLSRFVGPSVSLRGSQSVCGALSGLLDGSQSVYGGPQWSWMALSWCAVSAGSSVVLNGLFSVGSWGSQSVCGALNRSVGPKSVFRILSRPVGPSLILDGSQLVGVTLSGLPKGSQLVYGALSGLDGTQSVCGPSVGLNGYQSVCRLSMGLDGSQSVCWALSGPEYFPICLWALSGPQ